MRIHPKPAHGPPPSPSLPLAAVSPDLIARPVTDSRVLAALDAFWASDDDWLRNVAAAVHGLHTLIIRGPSWAHGVVGAVDASTAVATGLGLMKDLVQMVDEQAGCPVDVAVVAAHLALCVYDIDVWDGHHDEPETFAGIARVVERLWEHEDSRELGLRVIARVADVCLEPSQDDLADPKSGLLAADAFGAGMKNTAHPTLWRHWCAALGFVDRG